MKCKGAFENGGICKQGPDCKGEKETCFKGERSQETQPVFPSNSSGLLGRMRALEADHARDGWPAVQMKDISALCQMVEGAKLLRGSPDRLKWNPDGYWLDGVPVGPLLENAFYLAGK